MNYLRNPEIKKLLLVHMVITAVFIGAGVFVGLKTCLLLAGMSICILAACLALNYKKYNKIAQLCDDIDKVLNGNDDMLFADYEEGELSILQSEIRKMTVRLREQNAALKDDKIYLKNAMADISHQLRTPLTSMNLIVTLLGKNDTDEIQKGKYLRELSELLDRTQWLIDDILKLSQFDAGVIELKKETVYTDNLVKFAVAPLEIPMELSGIDFCCEISEPAVFVADLKWTGEAVQNVLKNCMEHTSSGGKITVKQTCNALYTQLEISDTATGISPKDLPHIFERFYRSSGSSGSGFGIGLALAKKIVTSQNGVVLAENNKDCGAKFTLRFYNSVI